MTVDPSVVLMVHADVITFCLSEVPFSSGYEDCLFELTFGFDIFDSLRVLYQQHTLCRVLLVQRDTVITYSCGGASVSSMWHLNSDGVQIEDVFVVYWIMAPVRKCSFDVCCER